MKKYFLALVRHKPSGKYKLVYYMTDYNPLGSQSPVPFTNTVNIAVFPDKVGGVFGGDSIELIAMRFTRKWFINLYRLC